jgi:hypothetical protein
MASNHLGTVVSKSRCIRSVIMYKALGKNNNQVEKTKSCFHFLIFTILLKEELMIKGIYAKNKFHTRKIKLNFPE